MGIGDWGLGIGDWGLGIGPNPQSPIPHPHSKKRYFNKIKIMTFILKIFKILSFNYIYLKFIDLLLI